MGIVIRAVSSVLSASGQLPENVNYAVKSSFLLGFLESVPEVAAKLKEPNTQDRKFEDVVKAAEQAAVLVLVYGIHLARPVPEGRPIIARRFIAGSNIVDHKSRRDG